MLCLCSTGSVVALLRDVDTTSIAPINLSMEVLSLEQDGELVINAVFRVEELKALLRNICATHVLHHTMKNQVVIPAILVGGYHPFIVDTSSTVTEQFLCNIFNPPAMIGKKSYDATKMHRAPETMWQDTK